MAERDLILAVLGRACKDAMGVVTGLKGGATVRYKRRITQNAQKWIFSDREHPMSFLWVCCVLKLSESVIRAKVWKEIKAKNLQLIADGGENGKLCR